MAILHSPEKLADFFFVCCFIVYTVCNLLLALTLLENSIYCQILVTIPRIIGLSLGLNNSDFQIHALNLRVAYIKI